MGYGAMGVDYGNRRPSVVIVPGWPEVPMLPLSLSSLSTWWDTHEWVYWCLAPPCCSWSAPLSILPIPLNFFLILSPCQVFGICYIKKQDLQQYKVNNISITFLGHSHEWIFLRRTLEATASRSQSISHHIIHLHPSFSGKSVVLGGK